MYLRKANDKRTGRTYLSIVHGYRDMEGKSKTKVIHALGYLDELKKTHEDPVAYFTAVAKEMEVERLTSKSITITLDMNEQIDRKSANRKNYGCVLSVKYITSWKLTDS